MVEGICLLCCKSLLEGEIVVVRNGITTLIQASQERKDGKHESMVKADILTVHTMCRKNYTRRSSIKASSRQEVGEPAPKVPCLRPREFRFDYKRHCLFCSEVVESPNFKLPKNRRRQVRTVETKDIIDSILKACESRNDDFGEKIRTRVIFTNLVSEEAKYHLDCYLDFRKIKIYEKSGRPEEKTLDSIFNLLFNYLEENNECQYTSLELKGIIKNLPGGEDKEISDFLLKSRLKTKYKKAVIFTDITGKPTVFSFLGTAHNILCQQWYENREKSEVNERLRIVKTAAAIIKEDIRAKVYDTKHYPAFKDMEDGGKDLIPDSLNLFMKCLLSDNNKSTEKGKRRQVAINHAIISTCRPRSFISPVHLGLSVHLHAKYASRYLIDTLNSLGVCCSYSETLKYMNCAGSFTQPTIDNSAFVQYVFDNADVNTNTLDGFGTVHILGGVRCVTPKDLVAVPDAIPREKVNTVQAKVIPIKPYTKQLRSGLQKVIIRDLSDVLQDVKSVKQELKLDLLWMTGFVHSIDHLPSWNGYMQEATQESGSFQTSKIMPLPFVNLQATNLTTLHSALSFASSECAKRNQKCIVTFDQPLFLKSSEIVAAADVNDPLSSIIVRLGGFHCLMSFLGCIGQNMTGSGLEQLWETAYAKNTIPHMITGRAYARSLRAHILTLSALYSTMATQFPILKDSENIIKLCEELLTNQISPEEVKLSNDVTQFCDEFESKCEVAKAMGRTPRLWIQYFEQVVLVLQFIRAERTGNWDLHISTIVKMLPYFHSAGHVLYAKSAHLYVQKMLEIESQLSPREFTQFTSEGFFTIRRSDTFWNGTWSDMIIEQCLMRSMKSIGGLTHGRGITDSTLMRWVSCVPVSVEVALAFQKFSGVTSYTSDQHVEERTSRQARDTLNKQSFIDWMKQHNPFDQRSEDLVSLSSGLVADSTIDCDRALEKGLTSMLCMVGKNFDELVIPRSNKVKSLSSMNSSIKVRGNEVDVNSQQLFNRIICVVKGEKDLKECFKYELAPTPPSLFDEVSMRKGKKSSIVLAFVVEEVTKVDRCTYVLDGGHILHSIIWPRPATYTDVINNYTSHVISRYGDDCIIVFDGYPDHPTTKGNEQERRASRRTSADINISENTITTTTQAEFLSNSKNKKLLIKHLSAQFRRQGVNVVEAEADADVSIVAAAIENARDGSRVVVVGQDTDLLILLTTSSTDEMNIWFLRPGSQKKRSSIFFIPKQRQVHRNILNCLLFLHAMTGCDTTSALFRKSKIKALHILQKDLSLRKTVSVFTEVGACHEAISAAGEKFLLALYGGKTSHSLDEYRYYNYNRLISKQQLHSKFQLAVLPPTSAAAANHSYRTYLQVQQWMGNSLEPTDWGWQLSHGKLKPVTTHQDPAPSKLLNLVSCGCKSGCSKRCECKRAGLKCSAMCGWCQGLSCSNAEEFVNDDDID